VLKLILPLKIDLFRFAVGRFCTARFPFDNVINRLCLFLGRSLFFFGFFFAFFGGGGCVALLKFPPETGKNNDVRTDKTDEKQ